MADVIQVQQSVTFDVTSCEDCGIMFAVPSSWIKQKIEADGEAEFKCPNGHDCSLVKGDAWAAGDKLRDENQRMKGELARALHRAEQLEAAQSASVPDPAAPVQRPAAATPTVLEACWDAERGQHVCPACGKAFRGSGWFVRHMKVEHEYDARQPMKPEWTPWATKNKADAARGER